MPETMRRLALALAGTAVLLTGAAQAASTQDTPPPSPADACGSSANVLGAQSSWLRTSDGTRIYAVHAGGGTTAIVLAHEAQSDICEWLPYAKTLVDAGFRVLAFDFRGYGRSDSPRRNRLSLGNDLAAAVGAVRGDGANRVFLLGASMGGGAVVQNTSRLAVDGRISLSGTRLWRGYGVNNPAGVRRLREPFLYVGSRRDPIVPLSEALRIFRRVGSRDKRTAIYRGSAHGIDLVQRTSYSARARALIVSWIRSRS
jgi:pimeloyl-ACP methyl ester carboxylesterase